MVDDRSQRLVLFIDAQNVYRRAREAFFPNDASHICGQVDPTKLANLICCRRPFDTTLKQIRIYTGRPDSQKEPKSYQAHMNQCRTWVDAGVEVFTRTIRYPPDWPSQKSQQKGIDVALAIDFVTMAVKGEYDVGVIASVDTDLKPALEFVYKEYGEKLLCEVMAWTSPTAKKRLSIAGAKVWCHFLDKADYDSIADPTDYNLL